jgi:hypothetical protein
MKLSPGEKLALLMLCDISKRLPGKSQFDADFIANTIYEDQLWGFDWEFSGIPYQREETPPLVKETVDILDMFMLTIAHFKKLSTEDQQKVRSALGYAAHGLDAFPGFDGNNDPHYGIAQHLVEHLRRFKELPGATNNSHTETSLPRYQAMLDIYLPLRPKLGDGSFTADEFIRIFSV